ncbi:putative NAD+ synthase [Monocercomonoides exilis]|uniref:putative NAD+ synthase n=1 Tax=Monocercomonoides exilis TaxID=2049356 RepID=UPI00355A871E|nr:putative NAD+ synthase [Monocercomonoides exilis]|eukprot:MONOS_7288.1-p1 / transcript=MONOS_7288.1 / gene=MONOS_7288 / organism=Monocercomonoides_exilis_PA203 / gene_product=NH / transcript_product=NH / location=Mono_scaffold00246:25510-26604(-) / protein_length=295 / sequence_SO=supercontig / SO=protein_coding / is_pseudo=false
MAPPLHEDLKKALQIIREKRNFKPEEWIEAKCKMFNEYMKKAGLKGCVINMSGGVDSSCTAALCIHAMKMEGSPIKKVIGIAQPIHSTASIQQRAFDVAKAIGLEMITVDQTKIYDDLAPLVESPLSLHANEFALGQLRSYMRTPVAFFVAQILSSSGGCPSIVLGTGNKDEDGYLYYFCKAGDGISDVQLIADLHKSEVFSVSAVLGLPEVVLKSPPSADLWEGQTDEDEIGCSYDFVELYTELLAYPAEEREKIFAAFSEEAKEQYKKLGELIEGIHRRNSHKAEYPIDLNIL